MQINCLQLALLLQCHQRVSVCAGCCFIGLVLCSSAVPVAFHHALFFIQLAYVSEGTVNCMHTNCTLCILHVYIIPHISSSSIVSFQAISYEYAVEMTYPLPEGTSATMVNVVSQVSIIGMYIELLFKNCNNITLTHIQGVCIVMVVVVGQMCPHHVPIGTWFITGVTAFGALLTGEYLHLQPFLLASD